MPLPLCGFQDLEKMKWHLVFFSMLINVDEVPSNMKMELIELQYNCELKNSQTNLAGVL